MSTLNVSGVTAGYGKVDIIRDIAIEIPSGGRVALVGSNGAGKSTIVRAINGLIPARSGAIFWTGRTSAVTRFQTGLAWVSRRCRKAACCFPNALSSRI